MATRNGGSGAGSPTMDASTATDRWNEMLKITASIWQDQLGRWSDILLRMREGRYDANQWLRDLAGMWDAWAELATAPIQLASQQARQLPTLLLIVDGAAEFHPPQDAPTNIFLPPGVTTEVTDLYRVGNDIFTEGMPSTDTHTLSAKAHVRARLSPGGDRVEVSLVDLGRGQTERQNKGIYPGLYVGAVYAKEVSARRPLAAVHVFIEQSTLP